MASTQTGAPSTADIILCMDAFASQLKPQYGNIGLAAPGDTSSYAYLAANGTSKILGDGSTNYWLSNSVLKAKLKDPLAAWQGRSRYDSITAALRDAITVIESQISGNLPSGWIFTGATQTHSLDSYLLRANAANANVPTTPASAGTLTATTNAAGSIATCSSGNGPRVVHTLVGASGYNESLPSALATQVALSGSQNAYTYQIASTVPAGVTFVRVYRGYVAGGANIYYYDQQVAVTPGSSYPAITIAQPDSQLRTDWVPPSWLSCLMSPESAAVFALAFASASQQSGAAVNPLVFSSGGQLSPDNVFLTPSNGFLGLGNQSQSGVFGVDVVGTGYTAGTIATANSYLQNIQGFAGAGGVANCLQARVTSVLDAAGTVAPTVTFFDAAHGYGNVQTATLAAATFSGTAVGQAAVFTVTNGRLIRTVTGVANVTTTSGQYLLEAIAARSY
jgi:hypothetical protein